ncbi:hypothetical protein C8F04DRAFT_1248731 [Mycena alexandri]|uniref:Uncharacterized protein n=1 Tax=Mycena alexandri TaxID=1745969 RepID=A0AAD6TI38_9AGAR|nr:hypothetical protein C8F04DRAFT_1248731 [Mycena alexandri]
MHISDAVIDPALREVSDRPSPTTDGAIASLSTAPAPHPPSHPRTRQFSKEEIDSWGACNYAPRRHANESRTEYEQRLTLVTRKAPLSESCGRLSVKIPKSANLERLRSELANYWFTQACSRPNATSHSHTSSAPSRQHPADALNFYPPAEPLFFAPPSGILPTPSSTTRGEFQGAVPLFHVANATKTSTRTSQDAASNPRSSSDSGRRTQWRRQPSNDEVAAPQFRPRTSGAAPSRPSRLSASVPVVPIAAPSRSSPPPVHSESTTPRPSTSVLDPPIAGPSRLSSSSAPPRRRSRAHILRVASNSEDDEEHNEEDAESDAEELIKQYGVEGADEILGYDDEDDEGESDDEKDGATASDEEVAHAAFKRTTRVQAVRRAGGIKTQKAVVKDFNEWQAMALEQGEIKDRIIDEHTILLYIEYSASLARSLPSTPHSLTTRHQAATHRLSPVLERPITASSSLTSLDSTPPNDLSPAASVAASPIASPVASPAASPKSPPSLVLSLPPTPTHCHVNDSDSSTDSFILPSARTHYATMSTTYTTLEEQGSKAPVVTAGDLTQKTLREFEISFENYAARKSLTDKECYIRVVQKMVRSGATGRAERNRSPESELVIGGLDDATPQRG